MPTAVASGDVARVIVVGSVNVDLVVVGAELPTPGATVTGGRFSRTHGGKGGNQAAAAARLGAETVIVGAVGDDEYGVDARAALEHVGVDCRHLARTGSATGIALVMVDAAGENLISVAPGANRDLQIGPVAGIVASETERGDVMLLGLEIPMPVAVAAARAGAAAGARVVLDPAPFRPLSGALLQTCHVVTPNEGEATSAGGAEALLAAGADAVVVTLGDRGATLHTLGADPLHRPPHPVDAVDATGAGDAFAAALAVELARGCALADAVSVANAAGALATRAVGARSGNPTRPEVERLLAGRES